MNTLNQSDLDAVRCIIREIEEKSLDGDYLYRGEHKCYGRVSSGLFRDYEKIADDLPGEAFDIEYVQTELLNEAKRHIEHLVDKSPPQIRTYEALAVKLGVRQTLFAESNADFDILAEIQHYGGQTNLIDFTTDYLIALFFACDGSPEKPGRVILLKQDEMPNEIIAIPQHPRDRVLPQKSVFIRHPEGFIDPENEEYADTVCIPADRKEVMLAYLRQFHGIESYSIYNDLHGVIIAQRIHQEASKEFCKEFCWGLASQLRTDKGELYTEDGELLPAARQGYERAVAHYDQAIRLRPDYLDAYNNRSSARRRIGMYDEAIADCNVALSMLNPYRDKTYFLRGMARLHLHEWDAAKADLIIAVVNGANLVDGFNSEGYRSVEAFEKIIGAPPDNRLPESIKSLLTGSAEPREDA